MADLDDPSDKIEEQGHLDELWAQRFIAIGLTVWELWTFKFDISL